MENSNRTTIALAAGGTGGHIFPAISLANELIKKGYRPILFTDRRYLHYGLQKYNIDNEILPLDHFSTGLTQKAKTALQLCFSLLKACYLLKKHKITSVVGFGGYPSFPTVKAAQLLGIRTIIHEQNSILGRANIMLTKNASIVATSFKNTLSINDSYKNKIHYTGNPVRAEIQAIRSLPYPDFGDNSKLHILVTGGSQGAKIFAQVVPRAIKILPTELQKRIRIDQQCRSEDIDDVHNFYNELGVDAELATFFSDIPNRLASTHLVICRSGASSLSEAAAAGRPVIMVPLPTSKDNHQYHNAINFESEGAGILMTQSSFSPENLSSKLESFFRTPDILKKLAKNAYNCSPTDANKKLAELI